MWAKVNQWVATLVKGIIMNVNGVEEKTFLDRDLLNLELHGELYPLDAMCRMEMYKDSDDSIANMPWVLELVFDFEEGENLITFAFDRERHRLQFALTLRVLRSRNPHVDHDNFEVLNRGDDEDDAGPKLAKLISTNRYDVQGAGITLVLSLGALRVLEHLRSNNRHVYLEFFSDYPKRDKYLYARSSYNNLPGSALVVDGEHKKKEDSNENKEGKKNKDQALCRIDFDLKNVKLKIPKVPFKIHGRLMAKDDFFPTVVATFQLEITKDDVFDRRGNQSVSKNPDFIELPLFRTWKGDGPEIVASLSLRFLGYAKDDMMKRNANASPSRPRRQMHSSGGGESSGSEGGEEESEESEPPEASEASEAEEGQEVAGSGALGSSNSRFHKSSSSSSS
eukprot:Skav205622  [mRNA]  locus=scaffold4676:47694:48875:+ [translate_table: standard]